MQLVALETNLQKSACVKGLNRATSPLFTLFLAYSSHICLHLDVVYEFTA